MKPSETKEKKKHKSTKSTKIHNAQDVPIVCHAEHLGIHVTIEATVLVVGRQMKPTFQGHVRTVATKRTVSRQGQSGGGTTSLNVTTVGLQAQGRGYRAIHDFQTIGHLVFGGVTATNGRFPRALISKQLRGVDRFQRVVVTLGCTQPHQPMFGDVRLHLRRWVSRR